ncbi:MAG: YggT family protein [Fervidobacterium sp.]
MFILGNFFSAIGYVLQVFINFEMIVIIVAAIFSWIPNAYSFRFYHALRQMADWIERPLRRIIPPIGFVDITPLVAILLLIFLDRFLAQSLIELGWRLK